MAEQEKKTNQERIKEITESIEAGIRELFESGTYQSYLSTMSRFHKYSVNNTVLIHMQKPDATLVAGFNAWKNKFGRHVKKGEKGIQILAPAAVQKKVQETVLDPDTHAPLLDADGNVVTEEKTVISVPHFKPVTVFDVSQTEGKPLPALAKPLTGDVEHYEAFVEALRRSSPVPIEFEQMAPTTDGYFSASDQRIAIRPGMSEVQTVTAMVHEIGHSRLHDYDKLRAEALAAGGKEPVIKDRRTEEVEAESVAYSVCQYYGIETAENSFGYIAAWSKGKELKELKASLDTIQQTSSALISDVDRNYAEICKERGIDMAKHEVEETKAAPIIEPETNEKTVHKYYEDGNLEWTEHYAIDGSLERAEHYAIDGSLHYVNHYRKDGNIKQTDHYLWQDSTEKSMVIYYNEYRNVEKIERYNKDGHVESIDYHDKSGHLNHTDYFDETGKRKSTMRYELYYNDGNYTYLVERVDYYRVDGTIYKTDHYDNGKVRTDWFDFDGNIESYDLYIYNEDGRLDHTDHYNKEGHLEHSNKERSNDMLNPELGDEKITPVKEPEPVEAEPVRAQAEAQGALSDPPDPYLAYSRAVCDHAEELGRAGMIVLPFGGHDKETFAGMYADTLRRNGLNNARAVLDDYTAQTGYPTPERLYQQLDALAAFRDQSLTFELTTMITDPNESIISSYGPDGNKEDAILFSGPTEVCEKLLDELRAGSVTASQVREMDPQADSMGFAEHSDVLSLEHMAIDEYPMPDASMEPDALEKAGCPDAAAMLPLYRDRAKELLAEGFTIYMIDAHGDPMMCFDEAEIEAAGDHLFALERYEWEKSPDFRALIRDQRIEHQAEREAAFLQYPGDAFAIYQVHDNSPQHWDRLFTDLHSLKQLGMEPSREHYDLIYTGSLADHPSVTSPEAAYRVFNLEHPRDFAGHSLSVSDIVAFRRNGVVTYHYCDSCGFAEIPDFQKPENYLKNAEMALEDDYGMIDGIINNGPKDQRPPKQEPSQPEAPKPRPAKSDVPREKKSDPPSLLARLRNKQEEVEEQKRQKAQIAEICASIS